MLSFLLLSLFHLIIVFKHSSKDCGGFKEKHGDLVLEQCIGRITMHGNAKSKSSTKKESRWSGNKGTCHLRNGSCRIRKTVTTSLRTLRTVKPLPMTSALFSWMAAPSIPYLIKTILPSDLGSFFTSKWKPFVTSLEGPSFCCTLLTMCFSLTDPNRVIIFDSFTWLILISPLQCAF